MKKSFFLLLLVFGLLSKQSSAQTNYALTVYTADSTELSLSAYQGHKILIVVLPVIQTGDDRAFMLRLDSIAAIDSQAVVIAVPSYEDYSNADSAKASISLYMTLLRGNIILSLPVYTHTASLTLQDPLFSWLSHSEQNTHFDYDIVGGGTLFVINEQGELTGISGPEAMFSNKSLNRMLQ